MSNVCPKCGEEAMSAMNKIMTRPHVCQHCGIEVRMNLVYTIVISLVYFFIAVRALLADGISGGGMMIVLGVTAVYVGVCLFIPFEEKTPSEP